MGVARGEEGEAGEGTRTRISQCGLPPLSSPSSSAALTFLPLRLSSLLWCLPPSTDEYGFGVRILTTMHALMCMRLECCVHACRLVYRRLRHSAVSAEVRSCSRASASSLPPRSTLISSAYFSPGENRSPTSHHCLEMHASVFVFCTSSSVIDNNNSNFSSAESEERDD